jgi:hypothetical protein
MYNDSSIKTTAASITEVDIESFLTQIQNWQRELNQQRSYDDCIIGTLDGVLDIFFDCCVFS